METGSRLNYTDVNACILNHNSELHEHIANAALDLPVVHKSVKDDGACVRVLSVDGMASCDKMPEKYVTEWVE